MVRGILGICIGDAAHLVLKVRGRHTVADCVRDGAPGFPVGASMLREFAKALSDVIATLSLLRRYGRRYVVSATIGLVGLFLGILTPLLTKSVIDVAVPTRDLDLVVAILLGSFVVAIAQAITGAARALYGQQISADVSAAATERLVGHYHSLAAEDSRRWQTGDLLARVNDLRRGVQQVAAFAESVALNGIFLLFVPPIMLFLNVRLTVIALASLPASMLLNVLAASVLRRLAFANARRDSAVMSHLAETFTGTLVIKSLGAQKDLSRMTAGIVRHAAESQTHLVRASAMFALANGAIRALSAVVYGFFGWRSVVQGELSVGSYLAFSSYVGMLTGPLAEIVGSITALPQWSVSLRRALEILAVRPEVGGTSSGGTGTSAMSREPSQAHGVAELSWEGVTVAYEGGGRSLQVLTDVSLDVQRGERVLVQGPSGCGKSSLLKLATRILRPSAGAVKFRGLLVEAYPLESLRGLIQGVWQESFMLDGSLRDNILFGMAAVDHEHFEWCMRATGLDVVAGQNGSGYDIQLGEAGFRLSGGQRQRIALARAILRRPAVLLLDEASSGLEAESESFFLRSVAERFPSMTIVCVSHRPIDLSFFDKRFVFEASGSPRLLDRVGMRASVTLSTDKWESA